MELFTDYNHITDGSLPHGAEVIKPLIGLSVNIADNTSRIHEDYVNAVIAAGGVPLLIPATTDASVLRQAVELVDGLILTGGADIAGEYFGEETLPELTEVVPVRDAYDFMLLRLAADRQLPILGICRGLQAINVAFGGSLWQDVPSQFPGEPLAHSSGQAAGTATHTVAITEGTVLSSVIGKGDVTVNSKHHQAVKRLAGGFRVNALSPDGIVEGIEAYPQYRITAVQWHPENMAATGNNHKMESLFRFIVSEAELFRQAKKIHDRHLTVDSHCDTPMLLEGADIDWNSRQNVARVDLARMEEGGLDAVFMVVYIPQGERDGGSLLAAKEKADGIISQIKARISSNPEFAGQAVTFADALRIKKERKKSIFIGIENGYCIGRDIDLLEYYKKLGVVYITLCHNGANDICDSAVGVAEHGGLSEFGHRVVREMNRLGMMIDLSHCSESTFYDVLALSALPVVCTHSSVRALCDHPRNLTDDQIRALASKQGVVQVCLYPGFLADGRPATLIDAVDHIDHIVALVGHDHVGIGSDFDGGGGIAGCQAANEYINITVELLRRGYSPENIAKILGANLQKVLDTVQSAAQI